MKVNNNRANRPEPAPGDVWNANLYFDDRSGSKNRPVIVLEKRGTKFTVLMVTSHGGRYPNTDFKLLDPYEVMLDKTSTVRGDRLFQIPFSKFNYKLGHMCPEDCELVGDVFDRLRDTRAYKRGDY